MKLSEAWALRRQREAYSAALPDEVAALIPSDAEQWTPDGHFPAGKRVQHNDELWKSLQPHDGLNDPTREPGIAPSLWAKVLPGQDGTEIGEWVQPDSTNPYSKGDRVTHNGKRWESYVDGNVWEPGVYGWTEITE